MHIKEPLLLIRKSSLCSGSNAFPLSLVFCLNFVCCCCLFVVVVFCCCFLCLFVCLFISSVLYRLKYNVTSQSIRF